jgi:ABC-2 type transport system ATP-binding protein
MALVTLENVVVRYGDLTALDTVSCTFDSGAIGLLGPNGAGKTTLLKVLLGFVRPEQGSATLFGFSMPNDKKAVRQRLGYMPEAQAVEPRASAVGFLTYCGSLFGMTRTDAMERAHEVLNYVGMSENRYRKMGTYSTGMLQRVKFAQALIHDPKLLLLDEPTNGLDPDGRIEMLELIRELAHKRKVATILSSHLMPDVQHVCDQVVVINKGHVVRQGRIDDLTALRDGLIEIRVRENKEHVAAALRELGCQCRDGDDGTLRIVKPAELPMRALFEVARAQQTQIRHLRPVRHSLEEVFMEAINGDSVIHPIPRHDVVSATAAEEY